MSITDLASFFFSQIRDAEEERNRVYEPVIGVVTDNKDPEKLLRVKVKIPVLSMQDTTWWVPVVALGAGKDRGWFFLPEVNDEVLVAFEHGDINHPIIIGTLWNGQDKPPETNPGSNPKRVLVSRTGSRIELDDEKNTITIEDGGGKGVLTFKADDNKLIIEAKSGDVMIQAPKGEVKIVADGGIDMQATMNLDFRGEQKVNITGDGGVTLKASGMMALSGGQTEINKGAPEAAEAQGEVSEVADPVGGGGGGGGASSGGGNQGASGGSSSSAAPAAAPRGAAASRGGSQAPAAESEPAPVLVSARWEKARVAVKTGVALQATCAEMDGKSATFTIKEAESGKVVKSVTASCGASAVEASWTTPSDGPPAQFVFEVEADGKKATSGVLTLVKRVEVALMLDEEPAAEIKFTLRSDSTGETLTGTSDDKGNLVFEEAPVGEHALLLEDG